jgi:hypothetical protein
MFIFEEVDVEILGVGASGTHGGSKVVGWVRNTRFSREFFSQIF